jgi:PDZ domain-containing protein
VSSETDTTPTSVLVAPRPKWWAVTPAIVAIVVLVVIGVASVVPSEWVARTENVRLQEQQPAPYALVPASADSVNDRVRFSDLPDDIEVFDTSGDFFFVTVSQPEQSVLSWLIGRPDPVVDMLTDEARNGRRTASQNREISLQQMRTATQEAQFLALSAAGYDPTIEFGSVIVQDVLCREVADNGFDCVEQFPAAEVLQPADTILEVDGVEITTLDDLAAQLEGAEAGDLVTMTIERGDDEPQEVEVELSTDPLDPERVIVGFVPFDTRTVDLPFDVSIGTGGVGGPSAGAAFTLALIDELTDGELTGGRDIAVTGSVRLDGSIGPIGGLEQKVSAVHQHGLQVFLIPAEQPELADPNPDDPNASSRCDWECLNDAGDGEVVLIPVATLDDALEVLVTLGGDPIPA